MQIVDVSKSMEHKGEEALLMTKYGIETVIINGNKPNTLTDFIKDKQMEASIKSVKLS